MKKFLAVMTLTMAMGMGTLSAQAATNITVNLEGAPIVFDAQPVVENGTTLVPMRAIFEANSATVTWDDQAKRAEAQKDGKTIFLTANSATAIVDSQIYSLNTSAKIIDDRMFVPIDFVAEQLGLDVAWDEATQTFSLTTPATDTATTDDTAATTDDTAATTDDTTTTTDDTTTTTDDTTADDTTTDDTTADDTTTDDTTADDTTADDTTTDDTTTDDTTADDTTTDDTTADDTTTDGTTTDDTTADDTTTDDTTADDTTTAE